MLSGSRVLIVDDEANARRVLEVLLKKLGCNVLSAEHAQAALALLRETAVDLLITDLNMPGMNGLELMASLREEGHTFPVIVVTAYGTVETAVAAMKQGAFDFIIRPLDVEQVELVVRRALEVTRIQRENQFLRDESGKGWDEFIGQSSSMHQVYELIRQAGPSKASIFVHGETGTGKELVARAVHASSGRSGLFVPINCAAIPAEMLEGELFGYVRGAFTGAVKDRVGKFELADGGTLFLDEITEMPPTTQVKLLRVLQESRVDRLGSNRSIEIDLRVIAATNRNPLEAVKQGVLREDLYYRLNVLTIALPALRDRREDIPLLAMHFIDKNGSPAKHGNSTPLPDDVCKALINYDWPGNVRELENMIERALVLSQGGSITLRHFPHEILNEACQINRDDDLQTIPIDNLDMEASVEKLETSLMNQALSMTAGNKAKAARLLKISERTLWYKLKKYNIS
ncbi:MAG: sigma-54-dependent transcriptional regulator [Methylomonas sp.]